MNIKFTTKVFGAVAAALLLSTSANAAKCGKVTIADMNWASASLMANVDKAMLEAMGCEVELVAGSTMPTFTSMNETGQPDVAPEIWANAMADLVDSAVGAGRLHIGNIAPMSGLGEGWWVLPATLDAHPELTSVEAILARPDLFPDNEDPSKGAFHGCPSGWSCQLINQSLFKAWDMEAKGWMIVETGSAAGLDGSIAKAAERGENWFGYYWSPTALIGKYNMQAVDMGEYYRIPADTRDLNYNQFFEEGEEVITEAHEYHSHNTHRLNEDELTELLLNLREIQDDLKGIQKNG